MKVRFRQNFRNLLGRHRRVFGLNGEHCMSEVNAGIDYGNGHAFARITCKPCGFGIHIAVGILHLGIAAAFGKNADRSVIIGGENFDVIAADVE